jgi:hypothetical protein
MGAAPADARHMRSAFMNRQRDICNKFPDESEKEQPP